MRFLSSSPPYPPVLYILMSWKFATGLSRPSGPHSVVSGSSLPAQGYDSSDLGTGVVKSRLKEWTPVLVSACLSHSLSFA